MPDFDFQSNARVLYDLFLAAPPFPLRPMIKKALNGALAKSVGAGGAVAPGQVIAAVRATTPAPFVKGALRSVAGVYRCQVRCPGCTGECPIAP